MKKFFKIGLALALAVATAVIGAQAVLADSNTATHQVKGAITVIDTTAKTVTVKPAVGSAVTLVVNGGTVIVKTGVASPTLSNLAVNDRVTVTYTIDAQNNKIASKITVIPPLGQRQAFEGTIKSIAAGTVVVTTKKGDQTFQTNATTVYKVPGVKEATLTNFQVGDKVSVLTTEVTSGTTTAPVALRLTLIPAKVVKVTGLVTNYIAATATTAGSLTVKDKQNVSTSFVVNAATKIMPKGRTGVKVGAQVMVIGFQMRTGSLITAKSIHILKIKDTDHGQGNKPGNNNASGHFKGHQPEGNDQNQNRNHNNKNK